MIKNILLKIISNLPKTIKFKVINSLANELSDFSNFYEFDVTKKINKEEGDVHSNIFSKFILENFNLDNKIFFDIGCGDLMLYSKIINKTNVEKYFAHDINELSINHGIDFMKSKNINLDKLEVSCNNNFIFDTIEDSVIDIAWSHSLCSHLNINSILSLLIKLHKKMKPNGTYLCSFIILPEVYEEIDVPKFYLWEDLTNVTNNKNYSLQSFFHRDPYHYNMKILEKIFDIAGWKCKKVSDYGHDYQKMLFLSKK